MISVLTSAVRTTRKAATGIAGFDEITVGGPPLWPLYPNRKVVAERVETEEENACFDC